MNNRRFYQTSAVCLHVSYSGSQFRAAGGSYEELRSIGIGAIGAVLSGVIFLHEPFDIYRLLCVTRYRHLAPAPVELAGN